MIPRGLHVHMAGESCPIPNCEWSPRREFAAADDTLSTSARLALTEQRLAETERERDEAVGEAERLFGLASTAMRERDRFAAATDKLHGEWLDLKAELVSARQEIEQLRGAEAAHAELLDALEADVASEVYAYDALYCTTCYGRFLSGTDAAENHPHPLIPVRVTIAHRTEGTT